MTQDARKTFLAVSSVATGFSEAELQATGLVDCYFDSITSLLGTRLLGVFFTAFNNIKDQANQDDNQLELLFGEKIMTDEQLGPVANNLIQLWYLGQWNQMPAGWRNRYGASANDVTHVVTPAAYREGLVWQAIGSHPMGAKQPGFASWALAPTAGS